MPMSAEATAPAMPATVACAAAAGPAANGPMSGERKPNTPAKASAAEDRIERTIAAPCAAIEAAAPASSAPVRAATPAVVAAVFVASAATWCSTERFAPFDELDQQVLEHVLEGGVPVLRAGQQAAQLRIERLRDRIGERLIVALPARQAPSGSARHLVLVPPLVSMICRRCAASARATARRARSCCSAASSAAYSSSRAWCDRPASALVIS